MQAAFPTGAMWAAVEAHSAWLVNCSEARLYAPSAAGSNDNDDSCSTAVRRCQGSNWDELPVEVRLLYCTSTNYIGSLFLSFYAR